MSQTLVARGRVEGVLRAIPSKSHVQRLYALALLARGETRIVRTSNPSDDEQVALRLVQALGAEVFSRDGVEHPHVRIRGGVIRPKTARLHAGESALSLRIFGLLAATVSDCVHLHASGTLQKRTQRPLLLCLSKLGVVCRGEGDYPPLRIRGPITNRAIAVEGHHSSQLLTGLLMAYAAMLPIPSSVEVEGLVSRPYVEMTLRTLATFGVQVRHEDYQRFCLRGPPPRAPRDIISVEGDWSGMAFFIVGAMVSGGVLTLRGLSSRDAQPDSAILSVIDKAFQSTPPFRWLDEHTLRVERVAALPFFACSITHTPDLFPPLVLWACCARGTSIIQGIGRLVHKESNRLRAATDMLRGLRVDYSLAGDSISIVGTGGRIVGDVLLDGHKDHRMVMLAAMLGVVSERGVRLRHGEVVSKSFPDFFNYLRDCSVRVHAQSS